MKLLTVFTIIFSSLVLLGCNSQPTPTSHYYMLNQQLDIENLTGVSPIKKIQLTLPEYLKQPNLILQLSEHELSYAYYHMWAENLDEAITKSLQLDLKALVKSVKPEVDKIVSTKERANLVLNIDHFYATIDSKVVLAGNYTLVNTQQTLALSPQYSFAFNTDIDENGYPNSVAKMRLLVQQLAQDVYQNYNMMTATQALKK
ncbi:hypothetical protein A9Q77_11125 [Marinomonas sp. 42_23_T18]|nr:hypothetical protein A9Q77_11125 [Marinomonas sp. 42_23_T18]